MFSPIVVIVAVFGGVALFVWRDLTMNKADPVDWWGAMLLLGVACAWMIVAEASPDPMRPLERLHDWLARLPAIHPLLTH